jgi:hypothetical protein
MGQGVELLTPGIKHQLFGMPHQLEDPPEGMGFSGRQRQRLRVGVNAGLW